MPQTTTQRHPAALRRATLSTLWVGLGLTAAATVYPFVDRVTTQHLARHVGASYPAYDAEQVGAAVSAYLAILTVVGVLGAATWLGVLWAARTERSWAPWVATAALAAAVCWAAAALTVTDTSGDVGLAPALGWAQAAPCAVGVAAVVLLWKRR
jgi:hypothetical protein